MILSSTSSMIPAEKLVTLKSPSLLDRLSRGVTKIVTGVKVPDSIDTLRDSFFEVAAEVASKREEKRDLNTVDGLTNAVCDELDGISSDLQAALETPNLAALQIDLQEDKSVFVTDMEALFKNLQSISTSIGSIHETAVISSRILGKLATLKDSNDGLQDFLEELNNYVEALSDQIRTSMESGGRHVTSHEGIDILEVGAHEERLRKLAQSAYDNSLQASNLASKLYVSPVVDADLEEDELETVKAPADLDWDDEDEVSDTDLTKTYEVAKSLSELKEQSVRFTQLLYSLKTKLVLADPELRAMVIENDQDRKLAYEAYLGLYRATLNFLIGLLDVVPVVGEPGSWIADLAKGFKAAVMGFRRLTKSKKIPKWIRNYIDLTPAVSLTEAWMTELLEALVLMPSHLIFEFRKQFIDDLPIMLEFLERIETAMKLLEMEREEAERLLLEEENESSINVVEAEVRAEGLIDQSDEVVTELKQSFWKKLVSKLPGKK